MAERGGDSTGVGEALLKEVEWVFKLWHRLRDEKMSRKEFQEGLGPVKRRVKACSGMGRVATIRKQGIPARGY